MKHEAMPDHASFDVKLPNSMYSDYVISFFSYIIPFSFFYELPTLFDCYCTKHDCVIELKYTVCPRYNAPRYNADSGITRSTVAPEN